MESGRGINLSTHDPMHLNGNHSDTDSRHGCRAWVGAWGRGGDLHGGRGMGRYIAAEQGHRIHGRWPSQAQARAPKTHARTDGRGLPCKSPRAVPPSAPVLRAQHPQDWARWVSRYLRGRTNECGVKTDAVQGSGMHSKPPKGSWAHRHSLRRRQGVSPSIVI